MRDLPVLLSERYRAAYERLCDGGTTPEELDILIAEMASVTEELSDQIGQLVGVDTLLVQEIAGAAATAKQASTCRARYEHRRERVRLAMLTLLQTANIQHVRTSLGTVARHPSSRVVIDAAAEIPQEYMRDVEIKWDLVEIGKQLRESAVIPGVHLEHSEHIEIKV